MYCDVGVNDDGSCLSSILTSPPSPAFALTLPRPADESYHVCHKGYLSLFPFLLSLLPPDSPHLGAILELLRDPDHLWSPYGLRSLSASHPEFGQGENYWKGPIWIQMNYLALSALYKVRPASTYSISSPLSRFRVFSFVFCFPATRCPSRPDGTCRARHLVPGARYRFSDGLGIGGAARAQFDPRPRSTLAISNLTGR